MSVTNVTLLIKALTALVLRIWKDCIQYSQQAPLRVDSLIVHIRMMAEEVTPTKQSNAVTLQPVATEQFLINNGQPFTEDSNLKGNESNNAQISFYGPYDSSGSDVVWLFCCLRDCRGEPSAAGDTGGTGGNCCDCGDHACCACDCGGGDCAHCDCGHCHCDCGNLDCGNCDCGNCDCGSCDCGNMDCGGCDLGGCTF